jgi:LemA protein
MIRFLVIIISVLLLLSIIIIYNKLVVAKNRMQEAWSIIDVCLKKRHDLIPNLVEIVKGYSIHEKQVLEEITRCRTYAIEAQNRESCIQSELGLEKSLTRLLAVVENYPDLKASKHFIELQLQLTAVENELSMARRYYNGTVRENNIRIESFPSNLIAGLFKFSGGKFFEIDPVEKQVSQTSFDNL